MNTTGTSDPMLYKSNRFNAQATPLTYTAAVANGNYRVNLLFAENYVPTQVVRGRVFSVKINSLPVLQDFDIFATVGANTALVESFNTSVTNGKLVIEFDKLVENPKINAIEILPLGNAPLLTLKFSYSDGTPVTGSLHYAIVHRLAFLGGSLPLVNGQAACMLVSSPEVLGSWARRRSFLNLTDGAVIWFGRFHGSEPRKCRLVCHAELNP
jgi:hypothetical protein